LHSYLFVCRGRLRAHERRSIRPLRSECRDYPDEGHVAEYTADQMVAAATGEGLPSSRRLVRDWVELGLLDRPRKRGLGRGKGTVAIWSENQLQL
jgi:hypothetical protein